MGVKREEMGGCGGSDEDKEISKVKGFVVR